VRRGKWSAAATPSRAFQPCIPAPQQLGAGRGGWSAAISPPIPQISQAREQQSLLLPLYFIICPVHV